MVESCVECLFMLLHKSGCKDSLATHTWLRFKVIDRDLMASFQIGLCLDITLVYWNTFVRKSNNTSSECSCASKRVNIHRILIILAKQKRICDFFKLKETSSEVRKDNGSEQKSMDLCTAVQTVNDDLTKVTTKQP